MDPVSAALVLAVAGGAGGAVGDQAWRGLVALVHRSPAPGSPAPAAAVPATGGAPLDRLRRRPDDAQAAAELAESLGSLAARDDAFRAALDAWRTGAERLYPGTGPGPGVTYNSVTGGTFHGPVIQAGGSVHLAEPTPAHMEPARMEPAHTEPAHIEIRVGPTG